MKSHHLTDSEFDRLRAHLALRAEAEPEALMLELILRTGCRPEEAVTANLDTSFNEVKGEVFIKAAKGSKDRWIPLRREFWDRLNRWLPNRHPELPYLVNVVTPSRRAETQKQILARALERYQREIGFTYLYTPKCLRHTFAIRMLRKYGGTWDAVLKVQLLMGHVDVASTTAYLKYLQAEDMKPDVLEAVG